MKTIKHSLASVLGAFAFAGVIGAAVWSQSAEAARSHYRKSEPTIVEELADQISAPSTTVPAAGSIEAAFSPNEGSEQLVIKVIDSAKSEIDMMSYSFTSVPVVRALVRARHRGVVVRLVADQKENVSNKDTKGARASRSALGALVNAGADVRTISVYPIAHDKVCISDRNSVELGSFNYSDAAAHKNSENVLVNWNNPKLAEVYLKHFNRNYRLSQPYAQGY
jgi:phosphatidylserine/phosphatidylglycerophosphate/cardiolipin synthase-like enzyme